MTVFSEFLSISPKISVLPVIHGSGDFAIEVRRVMLAHKFDCLAVPLPPSFQQDVERAIEFLPGITSVIQEEPREFPSMDWSPEREQDGSDENGILEDDLPGCSYVPIDPCQPVIAALRIAIQERIPRAFIDLETERFESHTVALPDPYALKQVSIERFAAAVLPALPPPREGQPTDRVLRMAVHLRELETRYDSILLVCSIVDWPWIRNACFDQTTFSPDETDIEPTQLCTVDPNTLIFHLGELPFITGLYERARMELDQDENLSIDGLKELLLWSREHYENELKTRARKITPHDLSIYFKYVRNLALLERRMTPDLYTLVIAAQQIAGDQFALSLADMSRQYPFVDRLPFPLLRMGIDQARLPSGDIALMKNRLPGQATSWRSCELRPLPPSHIREKWAVRWNPYLQCSWPVEDVAIERFRTHVKDTALNIMGMDLARSEKFTTSLQDGLDIRETLRNWHTGDLYVRIIPPARGDLDCVIMLFDSPADPRDYPWRITWHAEHQDESTLSFFATDPHEEIVGPGIALARYGGAMFLFPPRPIADIWQNPEFDFVDTLEERLIVASCAHSRQKHIALLSHSPPGVGWRRLVKRFNKKIVHIPLSRFSQQMLQQLRMFHVLNGQQVRSYAAHFIRKA